jgi:hypothetical protein
MILVTGDVVLDFNLHLGRRMDPSSAAPGTVLQRTPGGAMLTYGILQALGRKPSGASEPNVPVLRQEDVAFGLKERTTEELESWPRGFHNYAIWEQDDPSARLKGDKNKRWRLARDLGFEERTEKQDPGNAGQQEFPANPAPGLRNLKPRILVIDDGALGFRHCTANREPHACWPELIEAGPEKAAHVEWIVLKMASPLGGGDLWQTLKEKWKEKLVVVAAARDLRRENIVLAQGLSWEQTAEDLLKQLDNHAALRDLANCRHLLVTLRGDGALWLADPSKREKRRSQLVFDPTFGEGEWEQGAGGKLGAYGFLSLMAASIAWRLWQTNPNDEPEPNLLPAMRAGLSACRILREQGNGKASEDGDASRQVEPAGYPFDLLAAELQKPIFTKKPAQPGSGNCEPIIDSVDKLAFDFGSVAIPSLDSLSPLNAKSSSGLSNEAAAWTILGTNTETASLTIGSDSTKPVPLFGPARRLALFGPAALPDIPCAYFGDMLSMDRGDVEALRSIKQLMLRYREKPTKQALSLAVFGAPGSGKSFGLKQIAWGVFGEKNPILEFNLSQFASSTDLYGAYHQVRDKVLAGFTPVVFWDEFDTSDYKWLQYLLAPMQDGVFQEGQLTHSIGRCVFIFAGGTSYDYEHFGPRENQESGEDNEQQKARRHWVMSKGPDFKSRLSAYLNILGPNPRLLFDHDAALAGKCPWHDDPSDVSYPIRRAILLRGLLGAKKPDQVLAIDRGLLTALLEVGHYRNGARSMEKLIALLKGPDGEPPSRARLPHRDQLELFVKDVDNFYELLRPRNPFGDSLLELAKASHRRYLKTIEGKPVENEASARPWEGLSAELKLSNFAAVERTPEILSLVGCTLEPGSSTPEEKAAVEKVLKQYVDILAREEHNGWWDAKRLQGWRFGRERKNERLEHPLMIPYDHLPDWEKNKDRMTIGEYPDMVREAGLKIVPRRPLRPQPK